MIARVDLKTVERNGVGHQRIMHQEPRDDVNLTIPSEALFL